MKLILIFLGLLILTTMNMACVPKPIPKCDGGFNYYKLPLKLNLTTSVDDMHLRAIRSAIAAIETQTGMHVIELDERRIFSNVIAKDGFSAVYVLNEWEADRPMEQGRTTIHFMSTNLLESDIRINNKWTFFLGSVLPSYANSALSLESLYMHEILHALGMMHNRDPKSVMFEYLNFGDYRMTVLPSDLENFKCLYSRN